MSQERNPVLLFIFLTPEIGLGIGASAEHATSSSEHMYHNPILLFCPLKRVWICSFVNQPQGNVEYFSV